MGVRKRGPHISLGKTMRIPNVPVKQKAAGNPDVDLKVLCTVSLIGIHPGRQ